jgi:hypothetical protein
MTATSDPEAIRFHVRILAVAEMGEVPGADCALYSPLPGKSSLACNSACPCRSRPNSPAPGMLTPERGLTRGFGDREHNGTEKRGCTLHFHMFKLL